MANLRDVARRAEVDPSTVRASCATTRPAGPAGDARADPAAAARAQLPPECARARPAHAPHGHPRARHPQPRQPGLRGRHPRHPARRGSRRPAASWLVVGGRGAATDGAQGSAVRGCLRAAHRGRAASTGSSSRSPRSTTSHVAQLAERGIPLVLVNRRTTGVHGSVVVDDERGSADGRRASRGPRAPPHRVHRAGRGHRHGSPARTRVPRRDGRCRPAVDARWVTSGPPTLSRRSAAIYGAGSRPPEHNDPTGLFVASLHERNRGAGGLRAARSRAPTTCP